jgi:hypothetical protein
MSGTVVPLAIHPDNVNTRENRGEGYLAMGRLDLAETQLDTIGGEDCDQCTQLAAAMAGSGSWPSLPRPFD